MMGSSDSPDGASLSGVGVGGGDDAQERKEHAHSQFACSFYNRDTQHTEVPEMLFVRSRKWCLVLMISWQILFPEPYGWLDAGADALKLPLKFDLHNIKVVYLKCMGSKDGTTSAFTLKKGPLVLSPKMVDHQGHEGAMETERGRKHYSQWMSLSTLLDRCGNCLTWRTFWNIKEILENRTSSLTTFSASIFALNLYLGPKLTLD
ncbi:hypothetical protein U0070_018054 [Myodes glareolus]|uniref:Uncharacterized protein n=1 Tax=Myodes glareolus TaxID=447135 RepID=A0AAW0IJ97_MYOGA